MFQPIKQIKISDEVYNQLKEAIVTGRYKSGDKLPSERELIETFKVSRTVIREAIRTLVTNSFVEIKYGAKGGAFVTDLTFERLGEAWGDLFLSGKLTIPEICEARMLIEPKAVRMSARNITEEYKEKLLEALKREDGSLEYPEAVISRSRIHYILAEMCGNTFLESIIKSLAMLIRTTSDQFQPPANEVHPLGMHDKLVEAVIAGDPDKAEQEMIKHLMEFKSLMAKAEQTFRNSNEWAQPICQELIRRAE